MRLLNIDTLEFREFNADNVPPYLVTSHRWSDDEATYKDVLKRRNESSEGYKKIKGFCDVARKLNGNLRRPAERSSWIWIDTCCINQNSSSEVSESINSMWNWYTGATHCIAYLRDVRPLRTGWDAVMFDFRNSEWFERGWTLQELLAPPCVIFVNEKWECIGVTSSKDHRCLFREELLTPAIAEVTRIHEDVLSTFKQRRHTIPKEVRMAWAANRRTTKVEDAAYCLLGIFDVHMPLIYGEGERNARRRLQQAILEKEQDYDDVLDAFAPTANRNPSTSANANGRDPVYTGNEQSISTIQRGTNVSLPGPHMPGRFGPAATPCLPDQPEAIERTDKCPLCNLLLQEPVSTFCNHTMCEFCLITDPSAQLTIAPLDAEGQAEGDAATLNFKAMTKCPICKTVEIDALIALPNYSLAQQLRAKYPFMYSHRMAALNETTESNSQMLTIMIGNWHQEVKQNSHYWSFFVKPNRTDIIKEVQLQLHESFPEPHVVLPKAPYVFHGQGWGYFTIEILVVLLEGYAWERNKKHPNKSKNVIGQNANQLKMEWTLDFKSFGGRGAQGKCRMRVWKVR